MAALLNKTVRLSREQIAALEEEGQRDRRDFSALVRIAVDDLIAARRALAGGKNGEPELAGAHKENGQ